MDAETESKRLEKIKKLEQMSKDVRIGGKVNTVLEKTLIFRTSFRKVGQIILKSVQKTWMISYLPMAFSHFIVAPLVLI